MFHFCLVKCPQGIKTQTMHKGEKKPKATKMIQKVMVCMLDCSQFNAPINNRSFLS